MTERTSYGGWVPLPLRRLWRQVGRIRSNAKAALTVVSFLQIVLVACLYVAWRIWYANPQKIAFNDFTTEYGLTFLVFTIVFSLVATLIPLTAAESDEIRLRRSQKERIQLLPSFQPKSNFSRLTGQRSIYESAIDLLKRVKAGIPQNSPATETSCHLKVLLCSPALDYPGRKSYNEWGNEFGNLIVSLAAEERVKLEFVCLPPVECAGHDFLADFLSVLASYCSELPKETVPFDTILACLSTNSEYINSEIRSKSIRFPDRVRLSHIRTIPFQIILTMSPNHKELVIAFAGKEILEDLSPANPQGFHSTDPFVVETFANIYDDYVTSHRRKPFPPQHTLRVVKEQELEKIEYTLGNYANTGLEIKVQPGVFSPLYGNSSKFTSWVVQHTIQSNGRVLDLGAGTGVQGLVAFKTLESIGAQTVEIVAVEGVPAAYNNLVTNCAAAGADGKLRCIRAALVAVTNKGNVGFPSFFVSPHEAKLIPMNPDPTTRRFKVLEPNEQIVNGRICSVDESGHLIMSNGKYTDEAIGQFDLIIADLPFVDARSTTDPGRAFYDIGHREHETFFRAAIQSGWLKPNGRIITSFSSLGGTADVIRFEELFSELGFVPLQRFSFYEARHMWIVYVLMKKAECEAVDFWLKHLSVAKK